MYRLLISLSLCDLTCLAWILLSLWYWLTGCNGQSSSLTISWWVWCPHSSICEHMIHQNKHGDYVPSYTSGAIGTRFPMHDTKNLCNYLANLNDDIQSAVMYLREHPELSDEDFAATVQTTE